MLRTGEVESEREVIVDGWPAYELKIRATLRGRAATIRYVVDRNTFYPIEHEVNGGGGIRFVEYEILPADRSLLQPASNPSPYEPTRNHLTEQLAAPGRRPDASDLTARAYCAPTSAPSVGRECLIAGVRVQAHLTTHGHAEAAWFGGHRCHRVQCVRAPVLPLKIEA